MEAKKYKVKLQGPQERFFQERGTVEVYKVLEIKGGVEIQLYGHQVKIKAGDFLEVADAEALGVKANLTTIAPK